MADASDNPLVTVVCSTFNSKATLRCALRSVLNQDFTNFEVRVMGDCCTDGSEQIVAELNDPRLHWFNFPKNTGTQSEPNNEGMRRARGKYIAFIGHDDLWMPWHLSRLVRHIEETGADLVHDLVANITPEGVRGVYGPPHERSSYARTYFPTMSWLHRRSLPDEIGFWRNAERAWLANRFRFLSTRGAGGKEDLVFALVRRTEVSFRALEDLFAARHTATGRMARPDFARARTTQRKNSYRARDAIWANVSDARQETAVRFCVRQVEGREQGTAQGFSSRFNLSLRRRALADQKTNSAPFATSSLQTTSR